MKQILDLITLGEPWKISEKSLSAVIPILLKKANIRNYVLLQEVKDKVDIVDTGSIGNARVKNRTNHHVFMRKGTLLKGATQARGVTVGTVIGPLKEKEVIVQCIHASKGIRAGAVFNVVEDIAPRQVERSFLNRRSQGATWDAVRSAVQYRVSMSSPSMSLHSMSDDLVGAMSQTQTFKDDIEDVLKKIPGDLEKQVGIAILDISGVLGVELFNHPDSWRAFSKSIVRNYADVLTKETTDLFELKMEKISPAVLAFLNKLSNAKGTLVSEADMSQTYAIDGVDIVGEYTVLKGNTIHLIGAKKEEPQRREVASANSYVRDRQRAYSTQSTYSPQSSQYPSFFRSKGAYSLLNALKTPKTWKALNSKVNVSTRTLSKRVTEAKNIGLVNHKPRLENGRMEYRLTAKGNKARKEAESIYSA